MLKFLRNKSNQKRLFLGMAAFIVPSFLIWGVTLDSSGGAGETAGKIGSAKITTGEFIKSYEALRRETFLFHGEKAREISAAMDFEQITWDRILLLRHAKRSQITVTNSDVVGWIARQPVFAAAGRFDSAFYERFVERVLKTTPRQFEEEVRGFLTIQKVIALFRAETTVTEEDAKQTFEMRHSARDLSYLVVGPDPASETPVSDKDLEEFYRMFRRLFISPETVKVRYAFLEKDSPLNRSDLREAVASGGLSEAEKQGLELTESGFLTWNDPLPKMGFSEKATDAIFKMDKAGDATGWLELEKGAAYFELTERRPARELSFDEAKPEIAKRMAELARDRRALEKAQGMRREAADTGFDAAAAKHGLEIHRAENFKRGDYLEKGGILVDFDARIAPLGPGEISEPIRTPAGFVIARVNAATPPGPEQWAKEKDSFMTEIRETAEWENYEKRMTELRADLRIETDTMRALFPSKYPAETPTSSKGPSAQP